MEYKKINSNKPKQRFYSSLMAVSLIALVCQPAAHAQINNVSSIVPAISLVLNEGSVGDETPEGPVGNVDCPSDAEVAEVLANGASDPRMRGSIQIESQSSVDALAGVIIITGSFSFESQAGTELDLSPLASIVQLTESNINIRATELNSLTGFDCLRSIQGNLNISGNPNLETINGFSALESIGGMLGFNNNPSLISIVEFQSLETIGMFLQIFDNANLNDVTGFNLLESVGLFFQINNNSNLNIIDGFDSLREVAQGFQIQNNNLTSVSGFSSLESVGQFAPVDPAIAIEEMCNENPNLLICGRSFF